MHGGDSQAKINVVGSNKGKAKVKDYDKCAKTGNADRPTPINTSDVAQEPPTTTINAGLSRRRNIVSGKRTRIG